MLNEPTTTGNEVRRGKAKAFAKWLLRLALGLVLILILIKWKGQEVRGALAAASWQLLAITVFFYLASQLLSALRWQLLFNAAMRAHFQKEEHSSSKPGHLSLGEAYRIYLIGMFWNLWMPTAIGGDAMRAYLASRHCGDLPLAASTVFMERLTGFVALIAIGVMGGCLYAMEVMNLGSSAPGSGFTRALGVVALAVGLLAVVAIVVAAARKLAYRLEHRMGGEEPQGFKWKLARLWIKAHRALDLFSLKQTRGALVQALVLSLVFQASQVVLNVFIAGRIGLDMPVAVFAWLVPSLGVASMLPLGIGGLGVREAAAVGLLSNAPSSMVSAAPGEIIAWSLLWQATLWLSALPGALAHALRKEA